MSAPEEEFTLVTHKSKRPPQVNLPSKSEKDKVTVVGREQPFQFIDLKQQQQQQVMQQQQQQQQQNPDEEDSEEVHFGPQWLNSKPTTPGSAGGSAGGAFSSDAFMKQRYERQQRFPNSTGVIPQKKTYSKQELLELFRPTDVLPEGFTIWSVVTSETCLPPINFTKRASDLDLEEGVNPLPVSPPFGLGRGGIGRGRGVGRGRGTTRGAPYVPGNGAPTRSVPAWAASTTPTLGRGTTSAANTQTTTEVRSPWTTDKDTTWGERPSGAYRRGQGLPTVGGAPKSPFESTTKPSWRTSRDTWEDPSGRAPLSSNTWRSPTSTTSGYVFPGTPSTPTNPDLDKQGPLPEKRRVVNEADKERANKMILDILDDKSPEKKEREAQQNATDERCWLYKNSKGEVQGPFTIEQLHEWLDAGFFSADLQVKRAGEDEYKSLEKVFQEEEKKKEVAAAAAKPALEAPKPTKAPAKQQQGAPKDEDEEEPSHIKSVLGALTLDESSPVMKSAKAPMIPSLVFGSMDTPSPTSSSKLSELNESSTPLEATSPSVVFPPSMNTMMNKTPTDRSNSISPSFQQSQQPQPQLLTQQQQQQQQMPQPMPHPMMNWSFQQLQQFAQLPPQQQQFILQQIQLQQQQQMARQMAPPGFFQGPPMQQMQQQFGAPMHHMQQMQPEGFPGSHQGPTPYEMMVMQQHMKNMGNPLVPPQHPMGFNMQQIARQQQQPPRNPWQNDMQMTPQQQQQLTVEQLERALLSDNVPTAQEQPQDKQQQQQTQQQQQQQPQQQPAQQPTPKQQQQPAVPQQQPQQQQQPAQQTRATPWKMPEAEPSKKLSLKQIQEQEALEKKKAEATSPPPQTSTTPTSAAARLAASLGAQQQPMPNPQSEIEKARQFLQNLDKKKAEQQQQQQQVAQQPQPQPQPQPAPATQEQPTAAPTEEEQVLNDKAAKKAAKKAAQKAKKAAAAAAVEEMQVVGKKQQQKKKKEEQPAPQPQVQAQPQQQQHQQAKQTGSAGSSANNTPREVLPSEEPIQLASFFPVVAQPIPAPQPFVPEIPKVKPKSLLEIQKEQAREQKRLEKEAEKKRQIELEMQRQQAAERQQVWGGAAAIAPVATKSLLEIQQEEEQRAKAAAAKAASAAAAAKAQQQEQAAKQVVFGNVWGAAPVTKSLKEIQAEEKANKAKSKEKHQEQQPQQPAQQQQQPGAASKQKETKAAAQQPPQQQSNKQQGNKKQPAAQEEDSLFWEYDDDVTTTSSGSKKQTADQQKKQKQPEKQQQQQPSGGSSYAATVGTKQSLPTVLDTAQFPSLSSASGGSAAAASSSKKDKKKETSSKKQGAGDEQQVAAGFGGGEPSAEFKAWCKKQFKRLQKKDDLTLMYFLLSLKSNEETRDYIHAYMGDSPSVEAFADEFIRNKNFEIAKRASSPATSAADTQQQPGGSKKKKKATKLLSADLLGFEGGPNQQQEFD